MNDAGNLPHYPLLLFLAQRQCLKLVLSAYIFV
jgi:hypothetical protein